MLINSEKLALRLCAILELDPSKVANIYISMSPGDVVKVIVEIVPTIVSFGAIRDAMENHADELREGLERTSA